MPLKLIDPREGKTPNYSIRGTYLGVYVDRTTGTADRKESRKALLKIKLEIERGSHTPKGSVTFASAALSYLRSGGDDRFLGMLTAHFLETPLVEIDQAAIDEAADILYPAASAATRNRQVYTPVSAILKHASVKFALRRPKGAQGEVRSQWLWPEQAFAIFDAAGKVDPEFRLFLMLLCYTGPRLSEGIWLRCDYFRLAEAVAHIPATKNGLPRLYHLPPVLVAELANHPRGMNRPGETVCRFRKNGYLYGMLGEVRRLTGIHWLTFHTFRHTWATWMRRYGGLDVKGLVGTGAWKDEKSAARYAHVVVTEEAMRADLLPTPKRGKSGE